MPPPPLQPHPFPTQPSHYAPTFTTPFHKRLLSHYTHFIASTMSGHAPAFSSMAVFFVGCTSATLTT